MPSAPPRSARRYSTRRSCGRRGGSRNHADSTEMNTPHGSGSMTRSQAELLIDLYAARVTPARVGRNLLGVDNYELYVGALGAADTALLIMADGTRSFIGSEVYRSGEFDRIRLRQKDEVFTLYRESYRHIPFLRAAEAPASARSHCCDSPRRPDSTRLPLSPSSWRFGTRPSSRPPSRTPSAIGCPNAISSLERAWRGSMSSGNRSGARRGAPRPSRFRFSSAH